MNDGENKWMNECTTKQTKHTQGTLGLCASGNIKVWYKKPSSHP